MQSLADPLEGLLDALAAFVRTPATKLLCVETTPRLRKGCVEAVMAHERHHANRSAFYLFEQGYTGDDDGWPQRTEHARAQHRHRATLMAEHGESLTTLSGPTPARAPHAAFAGVLLQLVEARPSGSDGLVVVLAPTTLERGDDWCAAIQPLLINPSLAPARFVLVETQPSPTATLADALGDRAAHVVVAPDPAAADRDTIAMLQGFEPGAPPRGASPSVAAPVHPAATPTPAPTPDAELRGAIAGKLMASALAMKRGQLAAAVQATREARDLSAAAGLDRNALVLDLMLGGQLLSAGSPKHSEAAFERVIASATDQGKDAQVATGQFALGASKLTRRDKQGALVCYAEGTVAAERAGQPALAIEGGRLTGSLALELGLHAQAIAFHSKAVTLAEAAGPVAPLTSAAESARALVEMCRKRGLHDQAAQFAAKADALGHIVVPEAPTSLGPGALDSGDVVDPRTPASPAPQPGSPKDAKSIAFLPVGVASAPAGAAAFGPATDDDEERTDMLSLDDVARMRAGVEALEAEAFDEPNDDGAKVGELDEADLEKLRAATFDVLDDESSSLLSREELAALSGERPFELPPLPPAPPVAPASPTDDALGFDLSKLDALRDTDIDDEEDGGATLHRRDAFDED